MLVARAHAEDMEDGEEERETIEEVSQDALVFIASLTSKTQDASSGDEARRAPRNGKKRTSTGATKKAPSRPKKKKEAASNGVDAVPEPAEGFKDDCPLFSELRMSEERFSKLTPLARRVTLSRYCNPTSGRRLGRDIPAGRQ